MDISQSQIVSFIWGIADDCLRDVFVRGQYREGNVNWVLQNAHFFERPLLPGYKAKLNLFEIPELREEQNI